jgi:intraflagellar transport protein 122
MNSKLLWSDKVPLRGDSKSSINDMSISPDGTRMIVAVGNRILLYNAETGDLLESLRGHKDVVYSVDYCYDGSRFASGGADNIVVIWKGDGKGMLKYTHTASIQRVKYNPHSIQLASCSDVRLYYFHYYKIILLIIFLNLIILKG